MIGSGSDVSATSDSVRRLLLAWKDILKMIFRLNRGPWIVI